jgi:uncharacterized protein
MRILISCLFSILLMPLKAQNKDSVVIGSIVNIHSEILNENRKIWIHVPASAKTDLKKRYPVVYLLDAEKNFTSVVGMIDLLSSINGNDFCPEMIIVGIPNINRISRIRDLTPTKVTSGLWIDNTTAEVSGGGEAFMAFIEKELIPEIDSMYHTTKYRMLIGHSTGGLTVINTLVHHRDLFKSYVAIDPSMWWDKQKLLKETKKSLETSTYSGISLFLGMAHTQPNDMDTTKVKSDTSSSTFHSRSILLLSRYLIDNRKNGLQVNFKYYDNDTHASVPLITTYDALRFIFGDYPFVTREIYFSDPSFNLALFIKDHFERIGLKYDLTSENSQKLLPPENLMNNLGFFVLGKKQFDKAMAMFKMNISNYPSSPVAYNYLGDLYVEKGDKKNAVECYKKSLSFKDDINIKKKLEKLEAE